MKRPLLPLLLLWAASLLLWRSSQQSFMAHDEGYYAQQARWILETGDWLTVPWWGQPLYDRAIGLQWLIALGYRCFGVSEGVARLPSALASLGAVFLTYAIGRRGLGPVGAGWGAAILAVTPIWVQASRLATQDIPLVAIELLGIWALLQAETGAETGEQPSLSRENGEQTLSVRKSRLLWGVLAGSTVGLAFMLKSFMAVLPVVALMPYLVMEHRRHRHLTNPGLYLGLLLGSVLPVVWLGLSIQKYQSGLPLEQLFGKLFYLSKDYVFQTSPFYYLWNIPANGFPWPLLALPGLGLVSRGTMARKWLWLGYPLLLFAELTYFDTRTWYYPLQLHPFLALLAAVTVQALGRRYRLAVPRLRWSWVSSLSIGLGVLSLLLLGVGSLILFQPTAVGLGETDGVYGWLGIGGGLGWLVPLGVWWRDRNVPPEQRQPWQWQLGHLLGPYLVISSLCVTGLWGNYSGDIKATMRSQPLAAILNTHPIDFVAPTLEPDKVTVLLTFYTPVLGQHRQDLNGLSTGSYAWVHVDLLDQRRPEQRIIAPLRDWRLVQG